MSSTGFKGGPAVPVLGQNQTEPEQEGECLIDTRTKMQIVNSELDMQLQTLSLLSCLQFPAALDIWL